MASTDDDDSIIWDVGVFDAHCHPTDILASIDSIAKMQAHTLTVMSTRREDQHLVYEAAQKHPLTAREEIDDTTSKGVVPAFGWHPWFSHQMIDDRVHKDNVNAVEHYRSVLTPTPDDDSFLKSLPEPLSLSKYLEETAQRLASFPLALVGEIGLDRACRLPKGPYNFPGDVSCKTGGSTEEYTPGSREGRPLTPYRVSLDHQKVILKAQLELAGKYQRAVSVHSVQTHGAVFDLLQELWKGFERPSKRQRKRRQSAPDAHIESAEAMKVDKPMPFPPRICMHSYSGPPDALKQFLAPTVPADVYFSFSICINFSTPAAAKAESVIKVVPKDRLLIESDLHCAGEKMDELLKGIVLKVCEIRQWGLEEGAKQLKENWIRFVFG